jgi:hypothetical protein
MLKGVRVACGILLVACANADDVARAGDGDTFAVRDSAGIAIAGNTAPEPEGVPRWLIDTVPSLTIGVEAGDPAYEFGSIQGVTQLHNGMIVVLNGQGESAFEFRFFDQTGKHLTTHGRRGEGPGEYRWVNFFGGTGADTVVAIDFSARRISWLSASDGYIRSIDSDENLLRSLIGNNASGITETLIPLGDSLYAVKTFHTVTQPAQAGGRDQLRQRANEFHIVNLAARTSERLTRLNEPVSTPVKLSSITVHVGEVGATDPMHVVDRRRSRICAGSGAVAEIQCLDAGGARRIIRWAYNAVPYTGEEKRVFEDRIRTSISRMRDFAPGDAEKMASAYTWQESHPAFSVLQMDVDGNFWILESARDAEGKLSQRFRVLDPDGRLIAFANDFPVRPIGLMDAHEIGDTAVLRAITSADDVPMLGVFRITKAGR